MDFEVKEELQQQLAGGNYDDHVIMAMPDASLEEMSNIESLLEPSLGCCYPGQSENLKAIRDQLCQEWGDLRYSDVIVKCSNGSVKCHKLILGSLSNMLRKALRTTMFIDQETIILAPEVQIETLQCFLKNVYTGRSEKVVIDNSLRYFGFSEKKTEFAPPGAASLTAKSNSKPVRGKKSAVWKFFEKMDKDQCRCQFCKKVVPTRQSSTSNMIRHLQNHHREAFLEYLEHSASRKEEQQLWSRVQPKEELGYQGREANPTEDLDGLEDLATSMSSSLQNLGLSPPSLTTSDLLPYVEEDEAVSYTHLTLPTIYSV